MPSIERPVALLRIGGVVLLTLTTAAASVMYTARTEAQPLEVTQGTAVETADVSLALFSASLLAYGWIVTKSYDLGKELGRKASLQSVRPKGSLELGNDGYEHLLD